jgi:hypothetical protein
LTHPGIRTISDVVYAAPDAWTADAWSAAGGAAADWHVAEGPCPVLDDVTYQRAIACEQAGGQQFTDA